MSKSVVGFRGRILTATLVLRSVSINFKTKVLLFKWEIRVAIVGLSCYNKEKNEKRKIERYKKL